MYQAGATSFGGDGRDRRKHDRFRKGEEAGSLVETLLVLCLCVVSKEYAVTCHGCASGALEREAFDDVTCEMTDGDFPAYAVEGRR